MESGEHAIENYVAYLYRQPPERLGSELMEILQGLPEGIPRLRIFVPEIGLMFARVMYQRDFQAVEALIDPLQRALDQLGMDGERLPASFLVGAPEESSVVRYYLGRLVSHMVSARRLALMDREEQLRAEYLDGGVSQLILEILNMEGPKTQRGLLRGLRARTGDRARMRASALLVLLRRLIRDDLISQRSGGSRAQSFALTQGGTHLLEQAPPWVVDVEAAYRALLGMNVGGTPTLTQRRLMDLFRRLDRSGRGRESSTESARAPRVFAYLESARLPPVSARGLPRILS